MSRINIIISLLFICTVFPQNLKQNYLDFHKNQIQYALPKVNEDTTLYLSQETYWIKNNNVWFINTITKYWYDQNGNNIVETSDFFNPQYDIPTSITKRFYDNRNRLIEEILLHQNSSSLDSIQKQVYLYNDNLYMKIIYELSGNNLQQSWRTSYYYDSEGNLSEEIEQQKQGADWQDEYKNIYSYNPKGNKVNSNWFENYNGEWHFVQQDSLFYDESDRIKEYIMYDNTGTKFLIEKTEYYILSKEVIEYYDEGNSDLIEEFKWIYNYNSDSTLKETLFFDYVNSLPELDLKWEYSYADLSEVTSVKTYNVFLSFHLSPNYPNPFNPTTNIGFQIAKLGFVSLKVYDVLGREVAILVNEEKPAGNYEVKFDGSALSSGIYFYKLSTENYTSVKKMILMK